jgi:predicted DsbA family dithiol-disulfide isomerase
MHPHARLAARAAIAAAAQNALSRFVEVVFAHQDTLDRAAILACASQAGLDLPRFTRDLDSEETAKSLAADDALADKLGVKGTPTSFVDDKLIVGAQPVTTFEEALH